MAQESRWFSVLRRLVSRRSAAWRLGRPRLLQRVFVAGSTVLRRDRAMLRAYQARGLTVRAVRSHLLGILEIRSAPAYAVLSVTDQLGPATAVDRRGSSQLLPADRPTRHLVVLSRKAGRWLIARVAAWPPQARGP